MTLLAAASESSTGLRILLGLAVLVALALAGSSRSVLPLRKSPIGKILMTGGWVSVGIGLILGPGVIGLLDLEHVMVLRPLVLFCLGWVGLMVGLQLRMELPKMLPARTWRAVAADSVICMIVLGAVAFAILSYGMRGVVEHLGMEHHVTAVILAGVLAASGIGWSAETRSIVGNRPHLKKAAGALRVVSGMSSIVAVLVYGVLFMLIPHGDLMREPEALTRLLPTFGIGLTVSLTIAVVCGLLGFWMMTIAGRGNSEFLVVLLGLVALFAGAAAMMGASALFVGMCVGVVIVNMPGKTLMKFQRVILEAEHTIAMALMLTAGVLADPFLTWWMWGLVLALVAARMLVKTSISRRELVQMEPSASNTAVTVGPLRQAPLGIAMATGFGISVHAVATDEAINHTIDGSLITGNQLVMIVVMVGLLSEFSPLVSRMIHPERWVVSRDEDAGDQVITTDDVPAAEGTE